MGRRVSKTVNGVTTVFVCSGGQVLAEYTAGAASTTPQRKYIYGDYIDEPIALIDSTSSAEETYYYHRNRQYSIIGLTNETGQVVERYSYTAYGDPTTLAPDGVTVRTTSDYGNEYMHTGRRFEVEIGLYYYRARYYSPTLGQFLPRDPLGYPDGLNTYAAYHVMYGVVDPMGTQYQQIPYIGGDPRELAMKYTKTPGKSQIPGYKEAKRRANLLNKAADRVGAGAAGCRCKAGVILLSVERVKAIWIYSKAGRMPAIHPADQSPTEQPSDRRLLWRRAIRITAVYQSVVICSFDSRDVGGGVGDVLGSADDAGEIADAVDGEIRIDVPQLGINLSAIPVAKDTITSYHSPKSPRGDRDYRDRLFSGGDTSRGNIPDPPIPDRFTTQNVPKTEEVTAWSAGDDQ